MSSPWTNTANTTLDTDLSAFNDHAAHRGAPSASPGEKDKEREPSLHSNAKPSTAGPIPLKKLMSMLIPAGLMLIIGFWVSAAHLFGLVYQQGEHTSRVHVPVVDFDGGAMGQALIQTAKSLSGSYNYPTYQVISAATTNPEKLQEDVYKGKYWAALFVEAGATERWEAAISGMSSSPYQANDTIKYVLMDARYYTFYQQPFYATSLTVAQAAASAFGQSTAGPRLMASSASLSQTQSSAFLAPIRPAEINANRAGVFGDIYDKVFYNTVGAVLPILMQFFFLMAVNGISTGNDLYSQWSNSKIYALRHTLRFVWPLITSLCSVGWAWAFKGGEYHLQGQWFLAFWAITYLYCAVSFNVLDLATAFIPMPFMSQFVLPWVIFNVASSLCSPEILNVWYRINYFFPAHHWWQLSMMALTKGGLTSHLHYALPVLLVWWVATAVLSIFGTQQRIVKERRAAELGLNQVH